MVEIILVFLGDVISENPLVSPNTLLHDVGQSRMPDGLFATALAHQLLEARGKKKKRKRERRDEDQRERERRKKRTESC